MIKKYCFLLLSVLIWVFALLNGTGLGKIYGTNEKLILILTGITIFLILKDVRRGIQVHRDFLISVLFFISIVWFSPFLKRGESFSFEYIYVFMLVYILSKIKIEKKYIEYTSYVYGALGLCILYIYSETNILKGWNENSIAMIGFFSYAVFCIAFFEKLSKIKLILLIIVSGAYILYAEETDSRTSTVFIILCVLIILLHLRFNKERKFEKRVNVILNVPLIIAILVIIISETSLNAKIDRWSLEMFSKPAFNGRDEIWKDGIEMLKRNFLLGTGDLISGYWHNSAIACLSTYGVLGYAAWITVFKKILLKGRKYLKDSCVQGSIIAFLVIFAHQSFELGFIAPDPNLIPYMCLGLLMGRIHYIESGSEHE